jgi:hypothetical protein
MLIYPKDRENAGIGKQNHFKISAIYCVFLLNTYKIDIDIGAIMPNNKKIAFIE